MRSRMRHRGFASIMAIALIPLLSMAMVTMAWRIKHEMYALREQKRNLELRELLHAGSAAARDMVDKPDGVLNVPVPREFSERASILLEASGEAEATARSVRVRVMLDGAKADRILHYGRAGQAAWVLLSIQ